MMEALTVESQASARHADAMGGGTFATSSEVDQIATSLAKAQAEMEQAEKGSANPFFHSTYANLGSVMAACMPHLNSNGICVVTTPVPMGAVEIKSVKFDGDDRPHEYTLTVMRIGMACRLIHASGQFIEGRAVADAKGTDPQAVGSTITYLRRYLLQTLVGVVAEDDDGNAGAGRSTGSSASRAGGNDPRRGKATGSKKVDPGVETRREALRVAILAHCEGDSAEAKSVLRDCTSGKNFEGFTNIAGLKQDWQVEQAVKRFEDKSGVTVAKE